MAILEVSQLCGFMVDMWTSIISWFSDFVGNYAWAIILLTLVIKLLLLPLDFFNKKVTRKNAKMQAVIQPELEKVKAKYGNDQAVYNQKVNEVYKKHNYNVVGSCFFMLINLVLTLVIFITLFNGLNTMAQIKITQQYSTLQQTYNQVYAEGNNVEQANNAVKIKYDEIKGEYSWLWISNVWKADMPTSSIPTFNEYLNIAREVEVEVDGETQKIKSNKLSDEQKQVLETEYNKIMDPLRESSSKTNGYIILPILIVGSAFLSQWLTTRKNKGVNGSNPAGASSKVMLFILPIMLGFFAFTYNAVFALYLLVSQLISLASTPLIDLILDKLEQRAENKKKVVQTVNYSRNVTNNDKKNQNKTSGKQEKVKKEKVKQEKDKKVDNQEKIENQEKPKKTKKAKQKVEVQQEQKTEIEQQVNVNENVNEENKTESDKD